MKSYKNSAGHVILVGDLIWGFSPGVFKVTEIFPDGCVMTEQVFSGKMEEVKTGRGVKKFHLDFATPFTKSVVDKKIDEIKQQMESLISNLQKARIIARS